MVRVSKVKNVAIKNAVKSAEPLTDDDYKRLDKMLKSGEDFSEPLAWDEASEVYVGKLPDNKGPQEQTSTKDGSVFYSVQMILPNGSWANFLTRDQDAVAEFESHLGCMVAVVGKLVEKPGTTGNFKNITSVRGVTIIEDPDFVVAKGKKLAGEMEASGASDFE